MEFQDQPFFIHYSFVMQKDGARRDFEISLDHNLLLSEAPLGKDLPAWTRLEFHQCPSCHLDPRESPFCPTAARLQKLVAEFSATYSCDTALVQVRTPAPSASASSPIWAARSLSRARLEREVASARCSPPRHAVAAATRGREALALLAAGARFDLILCDLMMPEMTGMDLYQELTRVAPEETERMVFLTGGAFTPRAQAFLDRMSNPRVEKPIDAQSLLALVDRLLR